MNQTNKIMKHLTLLALVFLSMCSCSSSDDGVTEIYESPALQVFPTNPINEHSIYDELYINLVKRVVERFTPSSTLIECVDTFGVASEHQQHIRLVVKGDKATLTVNMTTTTTMCHQKRFYRDYVFLPGEYPDGLTVCADSIFSNRGRVIRLNNYHLKFPEAKGEKTYTDKVKEEKYSCTGDMPMKKHGAFVLYGANCSFRCSFVSTEEIKIEQLTPQHKSIGEIYKSN